MVAVIQRGGPAEAPAQRERVQLETRRGDTAVRRALVERADARARQPSWAPTLAGDDLSCLLRVIEGELLPRLPAGVA